jgi:hypothetical protein
VTTSSSVIVFSRDELDLIVELAGCSLDESPGKNWVQNAGGLPNYICEIARAIKRTGKSTSQAIAIAVSRVKKWAAGGDDVDADTRAKAAKALAAWEALKSKNKAKNTVKASNTTDVLCLARTSFNVDKVRNAFTEQNIQERVEFREKNPSADYDQGPSYQYVKEMWTDHLICTDNYDRLYKVDYSVGDNGEVIFGTPQQVETHYVVVKADDMPGAEISDTTVKAMVAASGPCYGPVQELMLSRMQEPSALQTVLASLRRTGE